MGYHYKICGLVLSISLLFGIPILDTPKMVSWYHYIWSKYMRVSICDTKTRSLEIIIWGLHAQLFCGHGWCNRKSEQRTPATHGKIWKSRWYCARGILSPLTITLGDDIRGIMSTLLDAVNVLVWLEEARLRGEESWPSAVGVFPFRGFWDQ